MVSFIRQAMQVFAPPKHRIVCSSTLWNSIISELHRRGRGRGEAGCFLLGTNVGASARVVRPAFYDDLDPNAISSGMVRFDGRYYGKLWKICRAQDLKVVGDIHTHPGGAGQSDIDAKNPMVPQAGHTSIIVPNFAQQPISRRALGVYEYLGNHQWIDRSSDRHYLRIGS